MLWLDGELIVGPYLALALSESDFHKAMRKLKVPRERWPQWLGDESLGCVHEYTNPSGNIACVVCMRPKEGASQIENAGTLIHEAVHVWQKFVAYVSERDPSPEFEAYAIESIAKRLMQAYAASLS